MHVHPRLHTVLRRIGLTFLAVVVVGLVYYLKIWGPVAGPQTEERYSEPQSVAISSSETLFNPKIQPLEEKKIVASEETPAPTVANDSLRRIVMNSWIGSVEDLAQKSDIEDVRSVASFLRVNSVLARPQDNSIAAIDSTAETFIGFVVVLATDTLPNLNWQRAAQDEGINYFPIPNNCFVTRAEFASLSQVAKGLILLDKGFHAKALTENSYNAKDRKAFLNYVVQSHDLQNRVMSQLGGKEYNDLLTEEVRQIGLGLDSGMYLAGDPDEINKVRNDKLLALLKSKDAGFGKKYIIQNFEIHAMFLYLEKKHNNLALSEKISFIKKYYF